MFKLSALKALRNHHPHRFRFAFDIPVQTVPDSIPAVVVLILDNRQDFASDTVCFVRVKPRLFRRFFTARMDDDLLKST